MTKSLNCTPIINMFNSRGMLSRILHSREDRELRWLMDLFALILLIKIKKTHCNSEPWESTRRRYYVFQPGTRASQLAWRKAFLSTHKLVPGETLSLSIRRQYRTREERINHSCIHQKGERENSLGHYEVRCYSYLAPCKWI